tara:strand:- start:1487 stop:1696 length:210 start_codon:yes stop_codon:yes gene_type:complete
MVDVNKVTPEQEYVIARHSRMVGKILDLLEASMPEGVQCEKIKKLAQVPLYDFRNEMIRLVTTGVPKEL